MEQDELVRDASFGDGWVFRYYLHPRKETDGHGGDAEVHRKGEFCCKLVLAKSHDSRAHLLADLHGKCVCWVKDSRSRSDDVT